MFWGWITWLIINKHKMIPHTELSISILLFFVLTLIKIKFLSDAVQMLIQTVLCRISMPLHFEVRNNYINHNYQMYMSIEVLKIQGSLIIISINTAKSWLSKCEISDLQINHGRLYEAQKRVKGNELKIHNVKNKMLKHPKNEINKLHY